MHNKILIKILNRITFLDVKYMDTERQKKAEKHRIRQEQLMTVSFDIVYEQILLKCTY